MKHDLSQDLPLRLLRFEPRIYCGTVTLIPLLTGPMQSYFKIFASEFQNLATFKEKCGSFKERNEHWLRHTGQVETTSRVTDKNIDPGGFFSPRV